MALDAANFIAELSITDPPGTDPLSQGDDQIRTVKRATQQSFPFIDKQVDLDADQLNLAAIKNEANVFTVTRNRFTNQIDCVKSGATQLAGHFYYDEFDFARWGLFLSTTANNNNFQLQRRDALGVLLDLPIIVRSVDGVVEFDKPPEIGGAPLWIAGEVRQFVNAVTPGGNWFKADGTNGTVNLIGRHLMNESAFDTVGTAHNASLEGTADSGVSGSTAITESNMPAHHHSIRSGSQTGLTDTVLSFPSTQTVVGANRGNLASALIDNNSGGQDFIGTTGGGTGHTHTVPVRNLTLDDPDFTDSVRPLGFVVSSYQYVP